MVFGVVWMFVDDEIRSVVIQCSCNLCSIREVMNFYKILVAQDNLVFSK